HTEPLVPCPHTQINVVQRDGKGGLVKSVQSFKQIAFNEQARAGNSVHLSRRTDQRTAFPLLTRQAPPRVSGAGDQIDRHARVLQSPAWVQQTRAHHAHLIAVQVSHHEAEPVRLQRLYVVVQKQQAVIFGLPRTQI